MNNLIVVPRSSAALLFLIKLLNELDSVKEVKTQHPLKTSHKRKIIPFAAISESSLAKEWLSKEDNSWDEWYNKKKKQK